MASGTAHSKYNITTLVIFNAVILYIFNLPLNYIAFFSFGVLVGTFYLGPDLDLKSQLYKRWGIFGFIWIPYQKLFIHRSYASHFPIYSDVIRLLFLLPLAVITILITSVKEINAVVFWLCLFSNVFLIIMRVKNKKIDVFLSELMIVIIIFFGYEIIMNFQPVHLKWNLIILFLGLIFSTAIHTTVDVFYSNTKKLNNMRKKKK